MDKSLVYPLLIASCLVGGIGGSIITTALLPPRVKVLPIPFRYEDKVIVKGGFHSGEVGKITDRRAEWDNRVEVMKYEVTFDREGEKKSIGTFRDDELILIGSGSRAVWKD